MTRRVTHRRTRRLSRADNSVLLQACSRGLRFDFYAPRDRLSVLLLYAVTDYARAVVVLAEARAFAGIPVIARPALDAYVDISSLCDHPDYWQNLLAVDAQKWKTLLERASEGGNPVLKPSSKDALFPEGRRHVSKELRMLRANGVKTTEIAERFEKAGLTNEHESIYAILSDATHNNVSGLQSFTTTRSIVGEQSYALVGVSRGQPSGHGSTCLASSRDAQRGVVSGIQSCGWKIQQNGLMGHSG